MRKPLYGAQPTAVNQRLLPSNRAV